MAIQGKQISKLFLLLYFSDMINSLLASFYNKLTFQNHMANQMDFQLIITILKVICPVFGGFIVDHVQYSLNLLLMGQLLTVLSYAYFIACFFNDANEYLFFAIGFQVLAQQLQWIIIISMICKQFNPKEIPKQISYFFIFGFSGRLVSFLILLPITLEYSQPDKNMKEKTYFFIFSLIIGVVLLCCTLCIYIIFPLLKKHSLQYMRQQSHYKQAFEQSSLLQSFKQLLNTDRAVVALVAGLIMSTVQIWSEYQNTVIGIYFNKNDMINQYLSFGYLAQELPLALAIMIAPFIGFKLSNSKNKLNYLSTATTISLLFFLMGTIVMLFQEALVQLKLIIYIVMLTGLQYAFASASISSSTVIGMNWENYQTHGFSFGLMSMFNNLFQVWILSILIAEISSKSIRNIYQVQIICVFAICFSFIAFIITKLLQFVKQQSKERKINQSADAISLQHGKNSNEILSYN